MEYVVLAVVFLATLLAIVGGYSYFNRRRLAASDAVRSRLLDGMLNEVPASQATLIRSNKSLSSIAFLDRLLAGKGFTEAAQVELDRAGSSQTVGTFALSMLLGAAVGGLLGQRLAGPMFGAALAALGVFAPLVVLKRQQAARSKKFEQQLPEAVDMLVNAMKAGYSLQAAMKFIGDETAEPIGPEFTRFYDEQRLGMEVRVALTNLQERVGTLDMKMFVTALLIQRETGGNLAETLANLADVLRKRAQMKLKIKAMSSESKASAYIIGSLPFIVFGLIYNLNPSYMGQFFLDQRLIAIGLGGLVWMGIGVGVMAKMIRFEI